jgi:hypothetical protein
MISHHLIICLLFVCLISLILNHSTCGFLKPPTDLSDIVNINRKTTGGSSTSNNTYKREKTPPDYIINSNKEYDLIPGATFSPDRLF